MREPVGWGLVGASMIARDQMVDAIRAAGGEPVAVMSTSSERARSFAEGAGLAAAYTELDRLLADPRVEAVFVGTTNELHAPQTLAALAAGKHVLCEKPLAMTLEEGRAMVGAAKAAGLVLATNHHLRNAATHRAMRAAVEGGRIGAPHAARVAHAVLLSEARRGWRIDRPEAGGGVVLDILVHDVDVLRYLLADEPVEVVAELQTARFGQAGIEDGAMAILRFSSGLLAQIHVAFTVQFAPVGLELHGPLGSLVGRDVMGSRPVGEVRLVTAEGEDVLPVEHENLYAYGLRRFHAALRGEGAPSVSGEDGLRSLAVALAVLEAGRTGRRVPCAP